MTWTEQKTKGTTFKVQSITIANPLYIDFIHQWDMDILRSAQILSDQSRQPSKIANMDNICASPSLEFQKEESALHDTFMTAGVWTDRDVNMDLLGTLPTHIFYSWQFPKVCNLLLVQVGLGM